ncbi:similar to Saccharomyces cerevisiae YLR245C CDD1 Cytidine deaminase [Maudiozyma saulgeensis]|uniref:Similar to Saccharomyces cerevisiae YLR245C CDD1 Cytidine deaminase n=1 Tax=Maudiozyma saulgeensis TaxID=1789683 RepID=A0A1X7R4R6_9SACH|nr:similar to Saccharomyces cerevisiae YLR245C CDD1 Cytidine deaminase [Kazachstania saulgeensis]
MRSHGLTHMELEEIECHLRTGRDMAYCPYSKFEVGCVIYIRGSEEKIELEGFDNEDYDSYYEGRFYVGGNIENGSYGATMCAERVTIFKTLAAVEREYADSDNWTAIAIVGDINGPDKIITPCGMCRQVLNEFIRDRIKFPILMYSPDFSEMKIANMNELMPSPFEL